MESTMNTVILIFSIQGNHKFAKVYSAKCILSSNSPKFAAKFPSKQYFLGQKSDTPISELRSAEKGSCLETDEWILYCKLANAQGEYHKRHSC